VIEERLSSASGLRPSSAFLVIGIVLLGVALKVACAPLLEKGNRPSFAREDQDPLPAYDLEDAQGRTLARFLERYDLECSPRSLWQAHTPVLLAQALSEAVAGRHGPDELLERMLPGMQSGVLRARGLPLSAQQALDVRQWLEREKIQGVWLERDAERGAFVLAWSPTLLLSPEQRAQHKHKRMAAWWAEVHKGLLSALYPSEFEDLWADQDAWEKRRTLVWNQLMPSGYCLLLEDLPPEIVLEVDKLLRREGVNPLQLRIRATRERAYPQEHWAVLGDWGFRTDDPGAEQEARNGLELLADQLLEQPAFSWVQNRRGSYQYWRHKAAGHRARPYFNHAEAGDPPARVRTTIDLDLQRQMRAALEGVMQKHEAALAMAIALDLETGDVLAVDGVSRYGFANFLPTYHRFTPGSTFKVVTMACALEAGAVRPDDTLEVGHGEYRLQIGGKSRTIHEADGSLAKGRVSASQCLAYSSNAGMAQIGARMDDTWFRERLQRLGYGARPAAGMGPESGGLLPGADAGGHWSKLYTQASIGFGHNLEVTLWQHATALAAILRGGRRVEPRLLASVSQAGHVEFAAARAFDPASDQVLSVATSRDVREMMVLGAREGTGRPVCAKRDDLWLASKTGTAQKVPGEVCVHAYGAAVDQAARKGRGVTSQEYRTLKQAGPAHGGSCYTSSMALLGRRLDGGREVLVLVVVDDPTKGGHYGSGVAGPAAMQILDEALAVTRRGEKVVAPAFGVFASAELSARNPYEAAWKEALR
jgi:cell division protein FtsI/penicillin-binding protein 2